MGAACRSNTWSHSRVVHKTNCIELPAIGYKMAAHLALTCCPVIGKPHTHSRGAACKPPMRSDVRMRIRKPPAIGGQQARRQSSIVVAAGGTAARDSIQLATARLPADVNRAAFVQQARACLGRLPMQPPAWAIRTFTGARQHPGGRDSHPRQTCRLMYHCSVLLQLYQWASTLTTNGRNLPLALPLKTDVLPDGFSVSGFRLFVEEAPAFPV